MNKTRLLLIDDENELIVTLVERLQMRGFDVKGITDGLEALDCVMTEEFDVVVADLKMPGVSGEKIKEITLRRRPGTKVILMTGHGAQEGGPSGDDYLLKPFSIDALIERVEEALGSPVGGGEGG